MASRTEAAANILDRSPTFPLAAEHWESIVKTLKLSPQQAQIVEMMLRDLSDRQIAIVLGISESTIRTHTERIRHRTGAGSRMQLARLVLEVSHRVRPD